MQSNITSLEFSYCFRNIQSTGAANTHTDIEGLYNLIASPSAKDRAKRVQVQNIARSLHEGHHTTASKKQFEGDIYKLKQDLGFYFPSGTNPIGHQAEGLFFNGCIGFDFDFRFTDGHIVAAELKAFLSQFDFIPFIHLSSRGYGVKGLFFTDLKECDTELYKFAQIQIFAYLQAEGLTHQYDQHGYGKVCYFGQDDKPYLNLDVKPFRIDLDLYEAEKAEKLAAAERAKAIRESLMNDNDSQDIGVKAVKFIIENQIIIGSTYHEYLSFTAACINHFGYDEGADVAKEILSLIPKIETSNFYKGFDSAASSLSKGHNREVKADLGTILYIAFQNGFQYIQPIAKASDEVIEANEGEKLTDVLKRLNITPDDLKNKKLIAPTGLGKGYLVNWIADTTGENVILVCPNTLLVKQFERYGFTPFYANTDPELLKGAKKIAVTYHSFNRLSNLIDVPNYHVFLDEWQNFTSGANQSYLLKPLNSVIDCLQNKDFKAVTLLTGTDIFNFHPYFNQFKTLEVKATREAIEYKITDCKDVLAAAAAKAFNSIETKRTPIIFLNNKGTKLSKLKALLQGVKISVINADEKGSNDFENIVKSGVISEGVQCLICTSSLKEGNDILNNYSFDFIVADPKIGSIELRQLVGRARNAQDVKLHILKSENREKSEYGYNITKRSAKLKQQADDECIELNTGNFDFHTNQLAEKVRKGVQNIAIRINNNNVFEVDHLLLSNMVYGELVSCEYANDSYQQINLERLGFKLEGNETDINETNTTIKDDLKAISAKEKQTYETEYAQHIETLKAVPNVQKQIELMQTGTKAAKTIADRVQKLQDEFIFSPADCVELIADTTAKADFKLLVDRLRINSYLNDKTDNSKLSIFYKSMQAKFEEGQYYTPNEIREKVLASAELLKTVDLAKFDKDKERNTNILKELRKVFEVKAVSKRVNGEKEMFYRIENVRLVCLNKINETKRTNQITDFENALNEVFEDAPF